MSRKVVLIACPFCVLPFSRELPDDIGIDLARAIITDEMDAHIDRHVEEMTEIPDASKS